jgi:SAM-dependent methyltransferase
MTPDRIVRMASAFYESCVLFSASDLGVFSKLAEVGEADASTLARVLGVSERGATLLLDACVALGLLAKSEARYRNTAESAMFLVPGAPGDLSGAIRYNRDVYSAWGRLADMVRTGRPVEAPGIHLGDDAQRTRTFVTSMHYRALGIGRAVVPQLRIGGGRRVLDVGGGPGTYSVLLAKGNPGVTSLVLDLPAVVGIADELIREQGMAERVKTLAGDYRVDDFPGGNDAVLFLGVLHQESPESIRRLMKKASAALNPGGIIYVMDMMTDATHTRPPFSALFAVNMALTTESGWVFSDAELRAWMEGAGLQDFTVAALPSPMPHWLASAKKP